MSVYDIKQCNYTDVVSTHYTINSNDLLTPLTGRTRATTASDTSNNRLLSNTNS